MPTSVGDSGSRPSRTDPIAHWHQPRTKIKLSKMKRHTRAHTRANGAASQLSLLLFQVFPASRFHSEQTRLRCWRPAGGNGGSPSKGQRPAFSSWFTGNLWWRPALIQWINKKESAPSNETICQSLDEIQPPQVTSIRSIKLNQMQVNLMRAEQVTRGRPISPGKLVFPRLRFSCAGPVRIQSYENQQPLLPLIQHLAVRKKKEKTKKIWDFTSCVGSSRIPENQDLTLIVESKTKTSLKSRDIYSSDYRRFFFLKLATLVFESLHQHEVQKQVSDLVCWSQK